MKHQNLNVLRKTAIVNSLFFACLFFNVSSLLSDDSSLNNITATAPARPTVIPKPAKPAVTLLPYTDDLSSDTPSTPTDSPSAPAGDQEVSLPIDLPIIGTVNLIPFTENDPQTGVEITGMKVYMPSKEPVTWGPLTIDQGVLKLINDVPSYSARAAFKTSFGSYAATLSILKATKEEKPALEETAKKESSLKAPSFSRIVFEVKFDNKPTLEFIPGKRAVLTNVNLILEKNKPVKLLASTVILGQPVIITFSVGKESTDAWATLKNIPLASIIPQFNGTAAEKIQLNSFTFTAKDLVSKTKKTTYLINGKADAANLPGIESKEAQEVTVNGSYNPDSGALFTLTSKSLPIPYIGTVNDAKIMLSSSLGSVKLALVGNTSVRFADIGNFETTINASITNTGIEFSSSIAQTVSFADIAISNIRLNFSSAKKSISLTGQGNVQGHEATITFAKTAKGITAKAALTEKEIKPFGSIQPHIPGFSDLSLKDPTFTFVKSSTGYELFMSGIVTIFDHPLHGQISLKKTSDGNTVTLLTVVAPPDWKSIGSAVNGLKGTLFDTIKLEELTFIISSNDYHDTDKDVTYKKGMNFVSKTTLSGPLIPVSQFTGTPATSLITIVGYIAPDPLNSSFRAAIPSGVVLKKTNGEPKNDVTLGKFELEIAGNPLPTFSLLTTFIVKPSAKDDTLTFTSRVTFKGAPPSWALAGTMQGFWTHPFGISGIEIGNVAAQIDFGVPFPETGIPESIGIAGQMTLGSRHAAMALKIPLAGGSDMVLCGALDKLTLEDIIDTAIQLVSKTSGKKLPPIPLPDIGIQDMKLYVAPKATTIGELSFDQGVTVRGVIFVPGFKAFGNITASSSGLIAQASCTEIKYGPNNAPTLLISRAKEDTTFTSGDNKTTNAQLSHRIAPHTIELAKLVDAADSLDLNALDAPPVADDKLPKDQQESLKAARSADVACAPDNKLLTEYNGATMHIILNMEQDLSKQGILVSGLFKVADIFEQDAYLRMDKDGIEFNFETALGKSMYTDSKGNQKPLLQTVLNGKSSGSLSNPDFKIILDFQQYLISYAREQAAAAIAKAKADLKRGIAQARQESDTKLNQASKDAVTGIDNAKIAVKKAQDSVDAINKQIEIVKSAMRGAINDAGNDRAALQRDVDTLKQKINDKNKACR